MGKHSKSGPQHRRPRTTVQKITNGAMVGTLATGSFFGSYSAIDALIEPSAKPPAASAPETSNPLPKEASDAAITGGLPDLKDFEKTLLTRPDGKPQFLNYFASDAPQDAKFVVNIVTDRKQLPDLDNVLAARNKAKYPGGYDAVKKIGTIDKAAVATIKDYFRELERVTGIPVEIGVNITKNDSTYPPHLTIGGFTPVRGKESLLGFSSFPPEIRSAQRTVIDQVPLMLNVNALRAYIKSNNYDAIRGLMAHESGHWLGLTHSFEHPEINPEFGNQAAVMSYNLVNIPPISGTNTGLGAAELFVLRNALMNHGFAVPHIDGGQKFDLQALGTASVTNSRAWPGNMPKATRALSLMGGDGKNSLIGTSGSDVLATETGYCGKIDHEMIVISKDGRLPYCIVEGGFSVVESGDGNDLVIAARGTEQEIRLGDGEKEVAVSQRNIGDKTIVTDEKTGKTTLTLHYSTAVGSSVRATQSGDDIALEFASAGNERLGKITLVGQAEGKGVDLLRIVDNNNIEISGFETNDITNAGTMQKQLESAWERANKAVDSMNPQAQIANREMTWQNMLQKENRSRDLRTKKSGAHSAGLSAGRPPLPDSWNGYYTLRLKASRENPDHSHGPHRS